MPTPTTITVTATYRQLDGSAASGRVTFQLSAPLRDTSGNAIYPRYTRTVDLDSNGAISVALPATDDPSTNPSGLTYFVTERLDGLSTRQYAVELPYDSAGGTVDLADLAVDPDVTLTNYVLQSTYNAHVADTTDVHGIDDTALLRVVLAPTGTNDGSRINAAIAALGGAGEVVLGAGTWQIETTVLPAAGVVLRGVGMRATVLQAIAGLNSPVVNLSGVTGAEVRDLSIDGNAASQGATTRGLSMTTAIACLAQNVYVSNCNENAVNVSGGSGNVLRRVWAVSTGGAGTGIQVFQCDDALVDGCHSVGHSSGIKLDGCVGSRIVGSSADNQLLGHGAINVKGGSSQCVVSGCYATGMANGHSGIEVYGSQNAIVGNTIVGAGQGCGIEISASTGHDANDNVLSGNTIRDVREYGIWLRRESGTTETITRNRIHGNVLVDLQGSNKATYGILEASPATGNSVGDNTVYGFATANLSLQSGTAEHDNDAQTVPFTARGDLLVRGASANQRLAAGTQGQILTMGAMDPAWADAVPAPVVNASGLASNARWARPGWGTTGTLTTTAVGSTSIAYVCPYVVTRSITITAVAINVSATTAGAGSKARLALYSALDGSAGSLVRDFGTVAIDSTGVKSISVSPSLTLRPGVYYGVLIVDATGATLSYPTAVPLFTSYSAAANGAGHASAQWTFNGTPVASGFADNTLNALSSGASGSSLNYMTFQF